MERAWEYLSSAVSAESQNEYTMFFTRGDFVSIAGLSFIFGPLLLDICLSLLFVLMKHPYNVGDRIRLRQGPKLDDMKIYTVQKINLLNTEVRDLYNQCI